MQLPPLLTALQLGSKGNLPASCPLIAAVWRCAGAVYRHPPKQRLWAARLPAARNCLILSGTFSETLSSVSASAFERPLPCPLQRRGDSTVHVSTRT